jgi:hypothetical protein
MKKSAIENQFREKINAREIAPSKASWDRLDAMLTVAEKPKRNFRWLYVAASILGFLLLGTLYYNQNRKEIVVTNDTIVVNKSKDIPEEKAAPAKINLTKTVEETKSIKEKLVSTEIKSEVDSNTILSKKENQDVEKKVIQEEQIPIITRGFADCLERSGKNQKAEQAVVLQKSKYITADELLASVDNGSPKMSSIQTKSNVKVNSNELLTQVDGELDLSFREKAIKTVNQKIKAVKLALNNRNSE